MYRDPRGGHNRKKVNENFFKTWSPQMAYVLGLIYSDGAIEDVRKSSRTCYLTITSNDRSLLIQIRRVLSSKHKLYVRKPRIVKFGSGKSYLCAKSYILRIGNKLIFDDLTKLGLTPRKSLKMSFPKIPSEFFNYFLRGYFDGDGCVTSYVPKGRRAKTITVIFTSGCKNFLETLSTNLHNSIGTNLKKTYSNGESRQLSYKKRDSLKILSFMYMGLKKAPYLDRKYKTYRDFVDSPRT